MLSLTELARHALTIEKHYGRPMDIEWGKDGVDGKLYILQARPETVQSRAAVGPVQRFAINDPSTSAARYWWSVEQSGSGSVPGRCACLPRWRRCTNSPRARCWSQI
jgi:pyruvate, water dikinase